MNSDLHLDLVLRPEAGSIEGRLREDDGSVRTFTGWLGLMTALDRLLLQQAPAAAAPRRGGSQLGSSTTDGIGQ